MDFAAPRVLQLVSVASGSEELQALDVIKVEGSNKTSAEINREAQWWPNVEQLLRWVTVTKLAQ